MKNKQNKREDYIRISQKILVNIGGPENIQGVAHCATRLRIVLKDNELLKLEEFDNLELAKGTFVAGDQLQIIFGAGLVNEIYAVFKDYSNLEDMSLGDVKEQETQKMNPFQKFIKSLSDVFVEIMPAILAAALLLGMTGPLMKWDVVINNKSLYAIIKLASLASVGIFAILPMAVCYSATKRYGGRAILGMVVGAIMLDNSLTNAYLIGTDKFNPEVISLFGLNIELVGFQGGIIVALMMGFIVAWLDKFFTKKVPSILKFLLSPMLTVFVATILLFTIVGPFGRALGNLITGSLIWVAQNLGVFGYAIFAGFQQIIVITGLHHILGAIELQLLTGTGRNFLNPLMSVALMGQGGAVIGYLLLNWKNLKSREVCIASFISILFGVSEPAVFGITLRYKYPLIAGCIASCFAGAYVYMTNLASLGFGTTALPGIAIIDPFNNGYLNYIVAHLISLFIAMGLTFTFGKISEKKEA
ncbi:MAG: PTS transporter subunit EIIC [Cetobacterium sp.]|uniref:PTS transporter subunit EIIC n=1 Tax=Cetobacterium sp. TaxID=2071632 RepID=UPI003F3EA19B